MVFFFVCFCFKAFVIRPESVSESVDLTGQPVVLSHRHCHYLYYNQNEIFLGHSAWWLLKVGKVSSWCLAYKYFPLIKLFARLLLYLHTY